MMLNKMFVRVTREGTPRPRWRTSYPGSKRPFSRTEQEVCFRTDIQITNILVDVYHFLDESALYGGTEDYGSYEALANLTVSIAGVTHYSKYKRTLDLETALHSADFTANGASFSTYVTSCNCSTPVNAKWLPVSSSAPFQTKSASTTSPPTSPFQRSRLASSTTTGPTPPPPSNAPLMVFTLAGGPWPTRARVSLA